MKCGTVAVLGRANAGKSTLINVLVGEKVAIVSPKPQTTRDRIAAILNGDGFQIVFEDTPGLYKAGSLLNERMQKSARETAKDVDLALYVIDVHEGVKDDDIAAFEKFSFGDVPVILVLSKTDIMPKENIPSAVERFSETDKAEKIISVSARRGKNVKKLLEEILKFLPESEPIYPLNVISDRSERFMVTEIMREKILLKYDKEIPHGVAVVINVFEKNKRGVYEINLDIVCEKQNHKAIIIGRQGAALKETLAFARQDMEKFLGAKVFLEAFVKVKSDWRNNPSRLKEYGYGEDDFY